VTVVIPVWGAHYVDSLGRAVASVRSQDEEAPIVVVDNASDAEVPQLGGTEVVRSARRLSAGKARNLGLERVSTDFVLMLDADDELIEGALSSLRDGIDAHPGVAVYSMSLLEAETGARHRTPRRLASVLARFPWLFARATAVWSLYPIHGNAIMRTSAVRDAGGYPNCSGGEDWVLGVSQAFRGRVVMDPRPGMVYHAHPQSLWRRSRGAADLLAAAKEVRARLGSDPAVPRWTRAAIPLIAILQTLLIVIVRPVFQALRGRSA
jgi:glycosyltransferase involved in cell wall biosynthesis